MLPNLKVLQKKCEELGLDYLPEDGKKLGKAHCVNALRNHFLPEDGLPYEETTPMLCFAEWNLKPEEQKEAWEAETWAAQRKLNGCRLILHFVKGKGIYAHSRTTSVKTYRYEELTGKLLIKDHKPDFSATIDCEALIEKPVNTAPFTPKGETTKTSLHSTVSALHLADENSIRLQTEQDAPLIFHVFDIMRWNEEEGRGLLDESLWHREAARTEFAEAIAKTDIAKYFEFPRLETENKRELFDQIIAEGGEGVILKNLKSPYVASSSRRRDAWVKVKRRQEYDAFVTGFKRGEKGTAWENLVGALEFSVHTKTGETHVIGYATNLPLETREKISDYNAERNRLSLNKAVYNKVAEISGQDISARERRLSHCTIDRWRPKQGPDAKLPEDCQVDLDDLKSASEWVGS